MLHRFEIFFLSLEQSRTSLLGFRLAALRLREAARWHTYIHLTYILKITGVQASGVIIVRLLRQCCFVWSEAVGPHSSGNINAGLTVKIKSWQ